MEISKESIFISSIRTFFHTLLGTIGIFLALIPIIIFSSIFSSSDKMANQKNIINILPDLNGNDSFVSPSAPVVLQINIEGVIGMDDMNGKVIKSQLIESRKGLLKKDRVKAILLNLNTPGGGVNDSDIIYRSLLEYKAKFKVPIYAYVNGLCASGGMYIASAADKIYSSPVGIIGSVGVIAGQFFNFTELMKKIGVESRIVSEGKNKDMMSPFRQWKEGEDTSFKNLAVYIYERFVNIVTTARPNLSKEKLINEYGAAVFDPIKAKEYGYIDEANMSYEDTLAALLKAANIDPEKSYQVIEMQSKHRWLFDLFSGKSPIFSGKIKHVLNINGEESSQLKDSLLYLYQPGN